MRTPARIATLCLAWSVAIGAVGHAEEKEARAGDVRTFAGIEFVWIPSGTFMMGSPADEPGRYGSESPRHEVQIAAGFWMGRYEVTQEQWQALIGTNPSRFRQNGKLPVENVSWNECQEFINKLNLKTAGNFRLPSEAEWEYACRAGTTTAFHFGETITTAQANYDGNAPCNHGSKGVFRGTTTPVGSFPPNGWGLFDMHGNVWEWCQDWHHNDYNGAPIDGSAWESPAGSVRVFRGGSWSFGGARCCRSACRYGDYPAHASYLAGFRLAISSGSRTTWTNSPPALPSTPVSALPAGAKGTFFRGEADRTLSEQHALKLWAEVDSARPAVVLHWRPLPGSNRPARIWRRPYQDYTMAGRHPFLKSARITARDAFVHKTWGAPLAVVAPEAGSFIDGTVEIGKSYEYKVVVQPGTKSDNIHDANWASDGDYAVCGIEVPLQEGRGNMLLLVDSSQAPRLQDELRILKGDLAGDGWNVVYDEASPADTVVSVKKNIAAHHLEHPIALLFLLGRIPVPYSGPFDGATEDSCHPPDGHPDHNGAWPADTFYQDMAGDWPDERTGSAAHLMAERMVNRPHDGKYDPFSVPHDISFGGGRVDVSNMPAFPQGETELLRQYLTKCHNFKSGALAPPSNMLVTDIEWNGTRLPEAAWRLASVVGPDEFWRGPWSTLSAHEFLFAFGAGGGYTEGANWVGTTTDYVQAEHKAVFQLLYGSYFGDWDLTNNYLRAPLCSSSFGLATAWACPPQLPLDAMAIGEPIGACAKPWVNDYIFEVEADRSPDDSANTVHTILGDPSLRLNYPKPVSDVTASRKGRSIVVSWVPSPEPGITRQYVYRSRNEFGDYERITSLAPGKRVFVDKTASDRECFYMVRAVKLSQTPSATYYNASIGRPVQVSARP
jgi:formylglycine-generating enzyme required for sulfatase activity